MKKFTLAVHSLGNIGTRVVEAALAAPDCQCLGVIRRAESLGTQSHALRGLPEFADLASLEAAQGRPDVIALCGKGHETYQEIRGVKHPFDEKVVVAELLEELRAK